MAVVYLDERWPVLRGGERLPIDPYKRRLVYARDGYACQYCGLQVPPDDPAPGSVLQLDHIIPWSARGSDRSDNPADPVRTVQRGPVELQTGLPRASRGCGRLLLLVRRHFRPV